MSTQPGTIVNFGRNVSFQPQAAAAPHTELEVLELLRRHAGQRIRVMGRLHSWSDAAAGDGLALDLRHLNSVTTESRDGRTWATIGAGCQIKRILSELERQAGATLPSLGLISEQSLAGAMSTGTHGSGKHCLSHYADEIRIATYDSVTGEPVIRTITGGDELQAARCSLGCLGVILSIGLWARPRYRVEEHFHRHATLDSALAAEATHPLQQFFLIPWSWNFYGQHRRETAAPRSWLARLYRIYFFLTFDIGMHVVLLMLVRWLTPRSGVKFFYRRLLPWTVLRGWKVVDDSSAMLIMEHELFVHIETEIFVRRSQLPAAMNFVEQLLRHCDGEREALSAATRDQLRSACLLESADACWGTYTHHYPICVRRVQPDGTLMSMSSGGEEDWYSISIVSVTRPSERESFRAVAELLARSMAAVFAARPHWGKYCPIDSSLAANLYPRLPEFRDHCERHDPQGRFRNRWADQLLFAGNAVRELVAIQSGESQRN